MVATEVNWGLLNYSSPNPKLNMAVEEAVLRGRHESESPDTLRLWRNPNSVVVGGYESTIASLSKTSVDLNVCKKLGAEIVRRLSLRGVFYNDLGNLNFTLFLKTREFKSSEDLLENLRRLYRGAAEGIRKLGVDVEVAPSAEFLLVGNKRVSEAATYFFYDLMLFYGTLYVNTNLTALTDILRLRKGTVTSLSHEFGKSIDTNEVKRLLVRGFGQELGIELKRRGLTAYERKKVDMLYRWKYGTDEWNLEGIAPLALGKTYIEVYVAYPPTSQCRQLIKLVEEVTSDLQEKVEIKIWRRGLGIPPGETLTPGLKRAAKESIIPAIIVDGKLKFGKGIPPKNELRRAILEELNVLT